MDSLRNIKAVILDMDGVLWQDEQPIGDLQDIFHRLNIKGMLYSLVTNNATRSIAQFLDKLNRLRVNVDPLQIITSSVATAEFLQEKFPTGGPIFILGEVGLVQTLKDAGFFHSHEHVLAVVAGLDRTLTYERLKQAALFIREGALFIGTNADKTLPTPEGQIPGAGSILAALIATTGVEPIVMGKPSPRLYQIAMHRMNVTPAETLIIGDRLETDILGGQQIGCKTALVLSGVTTLSQARMWLPAPDIIASDLDEIVEKYL